MKHFLLNVFVCLLTMNTWAQNWTTMMQEPGHNFYEIQAAFNEYWKDKNHNEKGKGYKQFKRWEHFAGVRVYPTGDLSLLSNSWKNYKEFTDNNTQAKLQSSSTWTAMGPFGAMSGVASNGFPRKAGRDNFMTFHPTNANTYWAGAPSGGLWKTTNNGASWSTNTDNLGVIGCSDLAIDPTNTNIMYLATGDGDAGDTYCIGVLKSTDGGATWNPTGLVFPVSQMREMRRLIINPINPQILLAATNAGIYRTINGGTSWNLVSSFNAYDLEFKPGNPNTVYAGGTSFYLSTNAGSSFTVISNGINTSGANRLNIAVTTADTNYVYVLGSKGSTNGLHSVHRSVNGGTAFSLMATSPDILANACSANPSGGGQGWYDLSFAASPLNKNEIVAGGINVWRSLNGGSTYSLIGCWIGTGTPPYVHSDHHELEYNPAGVLYSCNDGGIFSYTGSSWTDLTSPRNIAQMYKIGLSSKSPNLWITGHQDNGTNVYTGSAYVAKMAGDGMDCFIDRNNDNNMFASYYNGNLQRSINGGTSWTSANSGLSGGGGWVTPWKQDPVDDNKLYAGLSSLYISNNLGVSWSALNAPGGSGYIVEFAVAPSNNQVIYVIRGTSIRKTINGGTSWSLVSGSIPVSSAAPSFITVNPSNANMAWVTLSGYSAGNKVFQTTNGGASWTNISGNLPNLPANCSVYQYGSNDRIYVGMDVGVYYKDNTSSTWTLYNAGLPNVVISDLEISPVAPTKLRAATYGRGVYEVDVIDPSSAPVSFFKQTGMICENSPVVFTDQSYLSPTGWSWSVTPSTGVNISSLTAQNPTITFSSAGTYTVFMTSSNSFGAGSLGAKVVSVNAGPNLILSADSITACKDEPIGFDVTGAASYTWLPGNSNDSLLNFTAIYPQPDYTVTGTGANGCQSNRVLNFYVSECTGIAEGSNVEGTMNVYPNPVLNKINITTHSESGQSFTAEITDMPGRQVLTQKGSFKKGRNKMDLDISHLDKGVYILNLTTGDGIVKTSKFVKE